MKARFDWETGTGRNRKRYVVHRCASGKFSKMAVECGGSMIPRQATQQDARNLLRSVKKGSVRVWDEKSGYDRRSSIDEIPESVMGELKEYLKNYTP